MLPSDAWAHHGVAHALYDQRKWDEGLEWSVSIVFLYPWLRYVYACFDTCVCVCVSVWFCFFRMAARSHLWKDKMSFMYTHCMFHWALFYLGKGDVDQASVNPPSRLVRCSVSMSAVLCCADGKRLYSFIFYFLLRVGLPIIRHRNMASAGRLHTCVTTPESGRPRHALVPNTRSVIWRRSAERDEYTVETRASSR